MNDPITKSVSNAYTKMKAEELTAKQKKIDLNKNNKIDGEDLAKLRKEDNEVEEGWDDMMKAVKAKSGPQPSGGSGVKKGTRYGGSNQKDEPEVKEKPTAKTKKKPFSEMLETYKSAGLKSLFESLEEKALAEEVESIEEEDTGYMDRYAVKNGKAVKDNPKQRNYDDDEPHHVYADSPEHAVRKYAKMKKPGMKKEEVEELDELSKDTLNSYVKKSFSDKEKDNLNTPERQKGLRKATSRLYKEDEEHIEELSTPTLASYVKKVGHEGAWTKKRTAGVNSALNKVKQNSMKSEEMDIDAINGVRMHTFKERFGDRDNNN